MLHANPPDIYENERPRCKQRGVNREILNAPRGRGTITLSAYGGLVRLGGLKYALTA